MVQIPLLKGTKGTPLGEFAETLPVNLEPVSIDSGISKGMLRSAMGANTIGTGPGLDRGGILYNGVCYRVMGTKLVTVSPVGAVTILADVGAGGPVGLTYGFGRLAIQSGVNLFYWDGATLTQVTDTDLGPCYDVAWMNQQFFSTDGQYIIAADITDPTNITATRYGSAESSPDAITGIIPLRNEMYVCGTETIEVQTYTGGEDFPLTASPGATIPIGVVGSRAKCAFSQTFAFVGAGRNHATAVWLAAEGTATKLSTRIVDDLIAKVRDQSNIQLEARVSRDEERLYVHLPTCSLVYLFRASQMAQTAVWYIVSSGLGDGRAYRARNAVLVDGVWIVGDTESNAIGVLTEGPTPNAIGDPQVFMSTSVDSETWSIEKACSAGRSGDRNAKVSWRPHRRSSGYMNFRFRGETGLPLFGEAVGWSFTTDLAYNGAKSFITHELELVGLPGRGVQGWAALEARVEALG